MDFDKHLKVPAQSARKRENLGIIPNIQISQLVVAIGNLGFLGGMWSNELGLEHVYKIHV